jgi:hypothetical protein
MYDSSSMLALMSVNLVPQFPINITSYLGTFVSIYFPIHPATVDSNSQLTLHQQFFHLFGFF